MTAQTQERIDSAWEGERKGLMNKSQNLYINYQESQKIRQALAAVRFTDDISVLDRKAEIALALASCLREETLQVIQQFGCDPHCSMLIIRSLPLDFELPETPYDGGLSRIMRYR